MEGPTVLLYNFTDAEVGMLRLRLKDLRGVLIHAVGRNAYGMTIRQVLAGQSPPGFFPGREFSRHMAVLCNADGPLLHVLLDACGQAAEEPILRAVLTETNIDWTGLELYDNLAEEEKSLHGGL